MSRIKEKPKAIYEYESGELVEVTNNTIPRGLTKDGKRPIKLYIPYTIYESQLIYVLDPKGLVLKLYDCTDKYVLKDGHIIELEQNVLSKELLIPLDFDQYMIYDKQLDGDTYSKKEAIEKFPECFI